jgi:hypothetical protein
LKRLILILIVFSISIQKAEAQFHSYLGAAPNYAGVGALRVGLDEWEVGRFSPNSLGINKLFKIGNTFYGTFGIALAFPQSMAFIAGGGFHKELYFSFGVRGELFMVTSVEGYSKGAGTLGVAWNF